MLCAVFVAVSACGTLPAVPVAEEPGGAGTAPDPGRTAFEPVAPPDTRSSHSRPEVLAREIYGASAAVEGRYSEDAAILTKSQGEQVVLFTRRNLPDDSVRGERYRLEFRLVDGKWVLVWAGRQVSCWPGRGHGGWAKTPCR
jgi:hypothetical protein